MIPRMHRLKRAPLLALLALGLPFLGWYLRASRTNLPPPHQVHHPVSVKEADLLFGEVVETQKYVHPVSVRNTSARSLTIRLVKSCDCARVEPEQFTLSPGESQPFTVTLDLFHLRKLRPGQPTRPYQAHVAVVYGTATRDQLPLTITGTVRSLLDVWPPNLNFKDEWLEGKESPEMETTIRTVQPLQWLVVDPSPLFHTDLTPTGDSYKLKVRAKKGFPSGSFRETLTLKMANNQGDELPPFSIQVTGNVVGPFKTVPAETLIGATDMGAQVQSTLAVQSTLQQPFQVKIIQTDGSGIHLQPRPQVHPAVQVYDFRYKITRPGIHREMVQFLLRDNQGKEHRLAHSIVSYGTTQVP